MEGNNVLDKLMKQSSVLMNHVQLIANGANGATGVLAPKLVELDLKKGTVKYHNKLSMEDKNVLHGQMDKLMKQSSVQINHVQLIVNGANGAIGMVAPKLVGLEFKKDSVKYYDFLRMEEDSVLEKVMKENNV